MALLTRFFVEERVKSRYDLKPIRKLASSGLNGDAKTPFPHKLPTGEEEMEKKMSFDLQKEQTPLQDGTQIEIPKRELEEILQSQNNLQMPSIHQIQGETIRLEVLSHEDRRNLTYHTKVLHPQHHQMKELYGVPHRLLERHHHTP